MRTLVLFSVTAILLICGDHCLADTITLVNGKTMKGRVVRRDGESVVILVPGGGRITMPSRRVVRIAPEGTTRSGAEGKTPRKTEAAGTAKKTGSSPAAKPVAEVKPVDPRVLARVTELISDLGVREGADARKVREEARAALVEIGKDAVPALCKALEDASELRRLGAAVVLGKIRSNRSARALLAAVYAGTPAKGRKPAWWEQRYLQACARSFMSVTGTSYDYDPDNVLAGEVAARMLAWWVSNYKRYPVQVGEKLVEKTDDEGAKTMVRPDPAKDIAALPARRYPGPSSKVRGRR
jgi:hypothetical protein